MRGGTAMLARTFDRFCGGAWAVGRAPRQVAGLCCLWLFGVFLSSCADAKTPTQLLVVVYTNLQNEQALTRVTAHVMEPDLPLSGVLPDRGIRSNQAWVVADVAMVGPEKRLPLSFGIVPIKDDPGRRLRLVVTGFARGADGREVPVVQQMVKAGFRQDEKLLLEVFLWSSCYDQLCETERASGYDAVCEVATRACGPVRERTNLSAAPADPIRPGAVPPNWTGEPNIGPPTIPGMPGSGDMTGQPMAGRGSDTGPSTPPVDTTGEPVDPREGPIEPPADGIGTMDDMMTPPASGGPVSDPADSGMAMPPQMPTAGSDAGTPTTPTTPTKDAGTTGPKDAGTGGDADGGGPGDADAGSGPTPTLPAAPPSCPSLATGTITLLGQTIRLWVGTPQLTPGPLLFYWHGTGSTANEAASMLGSVISDITGAGGMVASFDSTTGTGSNISGTGVFYSDDLRLADTLVACAAQQLNLDTRRIFTAGCSGGGLQSGAMVYLRAEYLAGAMLNSGGVMKELVNTAVTLSPVPSVIAAHGEPGRDVVIVDFADLSQVLVSDISSKGGFAAICNHGGGHCGAGAALAEAQWAFLKSHPFGITTNPYPSGLPSGTFPNYCLQQ